MAVGRAERFEERKPAIVAVFGDSPKMLRSVARVFELMEMAWHDCYGEVSPPEEVVEDGRLCSGGKFDELVAAAHMAVIDRRDLAVWANALREPPPSAA